MADQPGKEQMMKFLAPAAAAAVVIVLVGVLLAFRDNPDTTAPGNGKGLPHSTPAKAGKVATDTEGLSTEKPPVDGPEWKDVGDGLKVWDVKEGSGTPCEEMANVTIHYTGWLLNGKKFDSSLDHNGGAASEFSLTRLVQGWQKGIPGMKPGGIRRLYVPWAMAYGADGGNGIPPKADLVFEIKYFGPF